MEISTNIHSVLASKYKLPQNVIEVICNSPFKFTKEVINRGTLRNIRFQYFGVFEVMPSRVKYSLKTLEENFKANKITGERYNKRKEILENYENYGNYGN